MEAGQDRPTWANTWPSQNQQALGFQPPPIPRLRTMPLFHALAFAFSCMAALLPLGSTEGQRFGARWEGLDAGSGVHCYQCHFKANEECGAATCSHGMFGCVKIITYNGGIDSGPLTSALPCPVTREQACLEAGCSRSRPSSASRR